MHVYNTKDFLKTVLSLHKTDTLAVLFPTMLLIGLYSYGVAFLEIEYLKLNEKSSVVNVGMLHSLLGFVLSLLLVFRTNTAYDRWWEGRKIWGKLVNDSRNFALKISAILPADATEDREQIAKYIKYFPLFLSRHLSKESTRMELDDDFFHLEQAFRQHSPLELMSMLTKKLKTLNREGKITDAEMLYLEPQISGFLETCGACERIKNTPIPYSYSSFIKKFIIFYVLALPVAYVLSMGYFMVPLTMFVFYVLMSLEIIAEEIEDPFNNDENDIPMEALSQNITRNVELIFRK